jgi:hypothetical protein
MRETVDGDTCALSARSFWRHLRLMRTARTTDPKRWSSIGPVSSSALTWGLRACIPAEMAELPCRDRYARLAASIRLESVRHGRCRPRSEREIGQLTPRAFPGRRPTRHSAPPMRITPHRAHRKWGEAPRGCRPGDSPADRPQVRRSRLADRGDSPADRPNWLTAGRRSVRRSRLPAAATAATAPATSVRMPRPGDRCRRWFGRGRSPRPHRPNASGPTRPVVR